MADVFIEDPKGYYAILGVAAAANFDDIKVAFRQRAKELHPDANPDENASIRFQKLREAYECLCEPATRSQYDVSGFPEPVHCSRCGMITSQPRHRIFQQVVSFAFSTTSNPVEGVFCAACARRTALKASLVTAARGWWGIPRGPITTVKGVLQNARGGHEPAGSKEALLWRNLLAFLALGKYRQVYDIARELKEADDNRLAAKAVKLMDLLQRGGTSVEPPDRAWKRNPIDYALHAGLLFIVPGLLFIAVAVSLGPPWRTAPARLSEKSSEATSGLFYTDAKGWQSKQTSSRP